MSGRDQNAHQLWLLPGALSGTINSTRDKQWRLRDGLPTKEEFDAMTGQELLTSLARCVDILRAAADQGMFDRVPA